MITSQLILTINFHFKNLLSILGIMKYNCKYSFQWNSYLKSIISLAALARMMCDLCSNSFVNISIAPAFSACSVSTPIQKCKVSNINIYNDKNKLLLIIGKKWFYLEILYIIFHILDIVNTNHTYSLLFHNTMYDVQINWSTVILSCFYFWIFMK